MSAVAKNVLIFARTTTKNSRRRPKKIRLLRSGGTTSKRVDTHADIAVTF